jgi:hypothetical protein
VKSWSPVIRHNGGPSSLGLFGNRSICGEASPKEAKELHDEGIEFRPLPDERN